MFRIILVSIARKLPTITAVKTIQPILSFSTNTISTLSTVIKKNISNFSSYSLLSSHLANSSALFCGPHQQFLKPQLLLSDQNRSVTKFSLIKGKRKSVKSVLKRFKRLDWGAWIRTRTGRNKKLFKKSPALKKRLKQHVFCNATQSWLLDSMVTHYWRKPKYYIDDPYEQYHKREEYFATRKKPVDY